MYCWHTIFFMLKFTFILSLFQNRLHQIYFLIQSQWPIRSYLHLKLLIHHSNHITRRSRPKEKTLKKNFKLLTKNSVSQLIWLLMKSFHQKQLYSFFFHLYSMWIVSQKYQFLIRLIIFLYIYIELGYLSPFLYLDLLKN